jgi:hypothetical protein
MPYSSALVVFEGVVALPSLMKQMLADQKCLVKSCLSFKLLNAHRGYPQCKYRMCSSRSCRDVKRMALDKPTHGILLSDVRLQIDDGLKFGSAYSHRASTVLVVLCS